MRILLLALLLDLAGLHAAHAQALETVALRGRPQVLHVYGHRGAVPVIVSSGDGGWMHLGPHIAESLAARGFFVVGFDVKAYLTSFTTATSRLREEDAQNDYRSLIEYASRGSHERPVLVGVSEGAGLSVLAATSEAVKPAIAGVIGFGLPDLNELGWRFRDNLTYLTHGMPDEPTFSTLAVIARAAPVPIVAVHSTRDEYVPLAEVQRVMAAAQEPKQLWTINATNHRFSGNIAECDQRLFDAIEWVRAHRVN